MRVRRLAGLFLLFFFIAFGLGYPVLNRYDPGRIPGLSDVRSYAAMTVGEPIPGQDHLRYRVLVPALARPFYLLAQGRFRSWDAANFGLLVADSLFVAGTALLIIIVGTNQSGNYAASLLASLLYMVNFCVPNMRLVGLVDSGEAFFLLAVLWSLSEQMLWLLPCILMLGAMTKESFVPLSFAFLVAWWIVDRRSLKSPIRTGIWIAESWLLGLVTLALVQGFINGRFINPVQFGSSLHRNHEYLRHFALLFVDRGLWFIFFWLLPTSMPRLKTFPSSWLVPTGATVTIALLLDNYYGGAGDTLGRVLFTVAGPILSLSSAIFLLEQKVDKLCR